MSMTLAELGNGSGFVYITKADGTTILSSIPNSILIRQRIQEFAAESGSLTDPTLQVDGTFGYKFFGNTTGSVGSLTGATEITRFIVNRGFQHPAYKKEVTIAGGVVTADRVANSTLLVVETQGGAGTDDLDTITSTDVVENDIVVIVGFDASHLVTVKHGTGNVNLANNANFVTAGKSAQLVLRYMSGAWYEVVRSNVLPTVANLRANGVACPVQGVNTTALTAGGGTINLEAGVDKGYQVYTGTQTLAGSWVIQPNAAPTTPYLDGDEIIVDYRALLTKGANNVTIFGIALTTTQALEGRIMVRAKYKLSNTTWYAKIFYDATGVDITNKAYVDATFEPALGNPAADGMILSSTAAGVRSWISLVTPDSGWNDLLGFTFLPSGSRPQYRLIGKQLCFRGTIVVPLSSDGGTTIIPYTSESSYLGQFYSAPYTGTGITGGVLVNSDGAITFNQNASVLPADIIPDGSYSTPYIIATRRVNSDVGSNEIAYTATVIAAITPAGKLIIATLYDFENLSGTAVGQSPLRFLNSNVVSADYAINFRDAGSGDTIHGKTAAAPLTYAFAEQAYKHQLTFDAALAQNLGGFNINIGGLKAYIE